MIDMQALLYELLSFTGPVLSALAAGFAVYDMFGQLYLTPAGASYLERVP